MAEGGKQKIVCIAVRPARGISCMCTSTHERIWQKNKVHSRITVQITNWFYRLECKLIYSDQKREEKKIENETSLFSSQAHWVLVVEVLTHFDGLSMFAARLFDQAPGFNV